MCDRNKKTIIGPLSASKLCQKGQDMNIEILTDNANEIWRSVTTLSTTVNSRRPNLRKFVLQIPQILSAAVICITCVLSDMRNGGERYLQRICDNSSTDSSLIYIIQTKALFSRTFIE